MTIGAGTKPGQSFPHRSTTERKINALAKSYWRISGKIHPAMVSPLLVGPKRVFLVHNPKCGGTTLKSLLQINAARTTHTAPRQMFRTAIWTDNLFVVAVRNPYDRFISSFLYHVKGPYMGKLVKRHGAAIKNLSPFEYFDFIDQYPENLGLQTNWTDYPCAQKPTCDIVLRLEEAIDWPEQLRAQGIAVAGSGAGALNSTGLRPDRGARHAEQIGLSQPEADRLRALIEQKYAADYRRFGYAFGASY